jgi:beta-glucanase (GH16 family)
MMMPTVRSRIGGLTIALGVGAAVVTGHGIAAAEPTKPESAGSEHDQSNSSQEDSAGSASVPNRDGETAATSDAGASGEKSDLPEARTSTQPAAKSSEPQDESPGSNTPSSHRRASRSAGPHTSLAQTASSTGANRDDAPGSVAHQTLNTSTDSNPATDQIATAAAMASSGRPASIAPTASPAVAMVATTVSVALAAATTIPRALLSVLGTTFAPTHPENPVSPLSDITELVWAGLRRNESATSAATSTPTTAQIAQAATSTPATGPFFDDFLGPAGSPPNPLYWTYDLGGGGWGNNELETYTNLPANVRLDGQGHLVIQAQKTATGYTSARLTTQGKQDIGYGTLMARIKFPSGQGIWPAFWSLGSNVNNVGWPQSGEIDMMELPNVATTYHTALHGPFATPQQGAYSVSTSGPAGVDLSADYHNYWVTRQPGVIVIGVDGWVRGIYTRWSMPAGDQWVFDAPQYAILNVAVGGNWPGPPNASTKFPATMLVDWIRYT